MAPLASPCFLCENKEGGTVSPRYTRRSGGSHLAAPAKRCSLFVAAAAFQTIPSIVSAEYGETVLPTAVLSFRYNKVIIL